MATELVSLDDLKVALNIDPTDIERDDRLQQALENAAAAIVNYCDRDFASSEVTEERAFNYDGSGILEIDDCQLGSITSVKVNDVVQSSTLYSAEPDRRSPVHYWLQLQPFNMSPAMGFTYNLDTLWWKAGTLQQVVKVTAMWGWPAVPLDVKQAAIWTAAAFAESPKPYISQSFESYSVQLETPLVDAIPARAETLLKPYQRIRL